VHGQLHRDDGLAHLPLVAAPLAHGLLAGLLAAAGRPAAGNFLRTECQFNGVVISDDIDAPAVARGRELHTITRKALTAGNDLLLLSAEADVLGLAARLTEAMSPRPKITI